MPDGVIGLAQVRHHHCPMQDVDSNVGDKGASFSIGDGVHHPFPAFTTDASENPLLRNHPADLAFEC